ncbi:protein Wnt-10a-like [Watersipora subatra]|uniref:protein Wnt-10a-like n=1 Tax=Watersipora subatra TaxID=2589382 RepID=UPI00355C3E71
MELLALTCRILILVLTQLPLFTSLAKNDILQFPQAHVEPTINPDSICKDFPALDANQRSICRRYPHATASGMQGILLAIHECQRQFSGQRWNCSNLDTTIANDHPLLRRGYRETGFTHAITAAGILHQVATSCALGKISSCSCVSTLGMDSESEFNWNGCSHDLGFGAKYSRRFLQQRDKDKSIQSMMQAHNSKLGRKAVIDQKSTKCKCHGMSSSCEIKTCWLAAPDLQKVGDKLKSLYDTSVQVDRTNSVQGKITPQLIVEDNSVSKRPSQKGLKKSMVFYEKSPTYCDAVKEIGVAGTSGRVCNKTSLEENGCSSLCCGRGFFTIKVHRVEKCNCKFHWCCYVECEKCEYDEWVTVCK